MRRSSSSPLTPHEDSPSPEATPPHHTDVALPTTPEGRSARPRIPQGLDTNVWACWPRLEPKISGIRSIDGDQLAEKSIQATLCHIINRIIQSPTNSFDGPHHLRSDIVVLSEFTYVTSTGLRHGSIDIGITATEPSSTVFRPRDLIGVIEVKRNARDDTEKASLIDAVDRQIRDRANAWAWLFQGLPIPNLILLGFVGRSFRPYLWQPSSSDPHSRNEDGQFPGTIRPSDGDLRMSTSTVCVGPQPSLWWDLGEDTGKIVFHQIFQDMVDLPARLPRFPELYGPPGQFSTQRREASSSSDFSTSESQSPFSSE